MFTPCCVTHLLSNIHFRRHPLREGSCWLCCCYFPIFSGMWIPPGAISVRRYQDLKFTSATLKGIDAFSWQHVLLLGFFFSPCTICLKCGVQILLQIVPLWLGLNEFPKGGTLGLPVRREWGNLALPFLSAWSVLKWQRFGCHLHRKAKNVIKWQTPDLSGDSNLLDCQAGVVGPSNDANEFWEKKKNPDNQSSFPNPSIFTTAFCKSWPWCDQLSHYFVRTGTQPNGVVSMTKWASFGNVHRTIYHFWS